MQYTVSIDISLPREKVVALFDNPANLPKWMTGLQSFEHLSGTPGQAGAKSKLVFQMGSRRIEMIETITRRNLPREFSGTYEASGVFNSVTHRFESLDSKTTRYTSEQEFRFTGFMKMIGFLLPRAFKKQTMKYLENFKRFAENEG
jgi:carbon monoxide dehydrogenase subunit G